MKTDDDLTRDLARAFPAGPGHLSRLLVPCHRVVRSDGRMGGYLGGVGAKRILLTLEAAA